MPTRLYGFILNRDPLVTAFRYTARVWSKDKSLRICGFCLVWWKSYGVSPNHNKKMKRLRVGKTCGHHMYLEQHTRKSAAFLEVPVGRMERRRLH